MSLACSGGSDSGATRRNSAGFKAADGLALAASPTFAIMALLTNVLGGDPAETLCLASRGSPLGGMATMYLLMSALPRGPVAEADPSTVRLRRRSPAKTRAGGTCKQIFGMGRRHGQMQPPFYCDYGFNIGLGKRVFLLRGARRLLGLRGDYMLFGPAVQVLAPAHASIQPFAGGRSTAAELAAT